MTLKDIVHPKQIDLKRENEENITTSEVALDEENEFLFRKINNLNVSYNESI